MAVLANFIGIDQYLDPNARDLTGARRDATALWALFKDSIPEIRAKLITDVEATVEGLRNALEETLGVAGPEDVVIFSFSGHGTHDHRLVAHNTVTASLTDTTISMQELADRFKASKARAILCILDCCFSGGAPARVLEDSPIARDIENPFNLIAGKGRMLIAASNFDEVSYELPGSGHGILTKALLDVLQTGEGPIELQAAIGQVMEHVRAEAARIGVTQTPVVVGHIEGGFTLPVLRPGENFFTAFPERRGSQVTSKFEDLSVFGFPAELFKEWGSIFPNGLNDLQLQTINDHRILDGASLLVVAPTSSGKTFIGEMAAARAITEGRKAVFLLPYRALVNEKYEQFSGVYGERLGMRVVRCTGDYLDQTASFVRGKYDLALLTYEMFLNIALNNSALLNQIGLVVLDEAQFITDPRRGINVELLLTYLITSRTKGISPQIIALSAVIGDVNDFDSWLGCSKLVTNRRPVPLTEGVLDRSGTFQFMDTSGDTQIKQLLPPGAIQVRRDKPSSQDMIVPLVKMLVEQNEKVIVFRNQRGPAQGCAGYLAKELALPAAIDALEQLPTYDLSTSSPILRECLQGGTAFHSTNLTREEKAIVEKAYRDSNSNVRVLAATTTVAAGINTPASTVILAEQEFIGDDGRPFTVAEYKNMAGRAGRLGFKEEGKAIILATTALERENLFRRYVLGEVEPLNSSFDPQQLDTWIIRLLAQVQQVPRQDVARLLSNTYGGYLAVRNSPSWRQEIEERLEELLTKMIALELIEEEGEFVQLTLLGRACGRSSLSIRSTMRLVELLRNLTPTNLNAASLLALVQTLPESDGGYTPMMRRGRAEAIRPRQAAERFDSEVVRLLQRFVQDEFDYFARCKRAAVLWDWINGVPLEEIEQRYTVNPYQGRISHGDVRKFADNTRFHLRSAQQITMVMFVDSALSEESMEMLLKQLEVGVPSDAIDLLSIPMSLGRGECLGLYQAGIKTVDDFWKQPSDVLRGILGSGRLQQLEKLRPLKKQ